MMTMSTSQFKIESSWITKPPEHPPKKNIVVKNTTLSPTTCLRTFSKYLESLTLKLISPQHPNLSAMNRHLKTNPSAFFINISHTPAVEIHGCGFHSNVNPIDTLYCLNPALCLQVMNLLQMGNQERTVEPTSANQTSSRSHALLSVTVRKSTHTREQYKTRLRQGKLYMLDLAGSERASQTKV